MAEAKIPLKNYFIDQVWSSNQVLVAILGICSALGVTTRLAPALTMGVAVMFVTAFSSLLVSLLRKVTPDSVRMITQLAIISLFVTIIAQLLAAFNYPLYKKLNVYIGLIITNCIVMGRAEGMAKNVPPMPAFLDGLGAGTGYALVLAILGLFRELFGFGEILNTKVIPLSWYATDLFPNAYQDCGLALTPPAAFFMIGMLVWIANLINKKAT
ncbi:MAG: nqrD [Chlamydiales bacterium]|jgi:Na+-transporting NADH:ubiquinone oxidoreductase subunit D|nr:nqrD [Chlamydiales bacterium]